MNTGQTRERELLTDAWRQNVQLRARLDHAHDVIIALICALALSVGLLLIF